VICLILWALYLLNVLLLPLALVLMVIGGIGSLISAIVKNERETAARRRLKSEKRPAAES